MYSTTITIGRNVGDEPMSDDEWWRFRQTARLFMVETFGTEIAMEWHDGFGEWNGVQEDSYKVTALSDYAPTRGQVERFREFLPGLAAKFHQDALAVTFGHSELITPKGVTA